MDIPVYIEIINLKHQLISIPLPQEFWETQKEEEHKLYLIANELEFKLSVVMMADNWRNICSRKRHSLRAMIPKILYLNMNIGSPNSVLSIECLRRKIGQKEDDSSRLLRKYLGWIENKKEN